MISDSFIGVGWSFPPQFSSPSSGPEMVSGEEEIRQAIRILITTSLGERVMHPRYGSGLYTFAFEEGNLSVIADLKEALRTTILLNETRIDLNDIQVGFIDQSNGYLAIDIEYTIRETNTRSNLVYPFYINEFS